MLMPVLEEEWKMKQQLPIFKLSRKRIDILLS